MKKNLKLAFCYYIITKIIVLLYYCNDLYYALVITELLLGQIPGVDFGKLPLSIIIQLTSPYILFWKNILPRLIIKQNDILNPNLFLSYSLATQFLNPMLNRILIYFENYFYSLSKMYS